MSLGRCAGTVIEKTLAVGGDQVLHCNRLWNDSHDRLGMAGLAVVGIWTADSFSGTVLLDIAAVHRCFSTSSEAVGLDVLSIVGH